MASRFLFALPLDRARPVPRDRGRPHLRGWACSCSDACACTSSMACTSAPIRSAWPASSRSRACWWPPLYGDQSQVLLAATASLPVLFALTLAQRRPSVGGMAITLLGIYWIGFGLAHAVLLRELPHGEGIVIDVLVGTFLGDTGAYLGGRLFGRRPLAPPHLPEQDRRGTADRDGLHGARRVVRRPLPGLAPGRPRARPRSRRGRVRARSATCSSPSSSARPAPRTRARLLGAHGGVLDRLDAVLFTAVVGYYIWLAYA